MSPDTSFVIIAIIVLLFLVFAINAFIKLKKIESYAPENIYQSCRLFDNKFQFLPQNDNIPFKQIEYIKLENAYAANRSGHFIVAFGGKEYIFACDPRLSFEMKMRLGLFLKHLGFANSGDENLPDENSIYQKDVETYHYQQ
jgi:hypothetical protein